MKLRDSALARGTIPLSVVAIWTQMRDKVNGTSVAAKDAGEYFKVISLPTA